MKAFDARLLIVGRGYLGTLFYERLSVDGIVLQRGSKSIDPRCSARTLLWVTGPGSADALANECSMWQERVDRAIRSEVFAPEPESVILISSAGTIYGECTRCSGATEIDAVNALSEYANFQARVEQSFSARFPGKLTILRITNPYGPLRLKFNGGGFISKVVQNMKHGDSLTVFGDGYSERDYIFEDDLVSVVQACVNQHWSGVFNVGFGKSFTQRQVIDAGQLVCNKSLENVIFCSERPTDLKRSAVDVSKIKKNLPNIQFTDIHSGLRKTFLV